VLKTGDIVDRYTVQSVLGHGGLAVVYRVRHNALGSFHALKVLSHPHPGIRNRLVREGQAQASLRHPNIVSVTDLFAVDDALGLVMELVEGPTLEQWIRDGGGTLDEVERLFGGILDGVAHAHRSGMLHRDLKPANILLQPGPQGFVPKVADFGLVRLLDVPSGNPGASHPGALLGTPRYMSPEQYRGDVVVDARTDVFALGCILFEMACLRPAFDAEEIPALYHRITRGEYPDPASLVPDLPERFGEAIRGCLAVKVEDRIPDTAALARVFATPPAPPPGVLAPTTPGPRRLAILVGLVFLALLTAVLLVVGWPRSTPSVAPAPAPVVVAAPPAVEAPPPVVEDAVPVETVVEVAPAEVTRMPARRSSKTDPAPVQAAPTRSSGTVRFTGEAQEAWLVDGSGGRVSAGRVSAGSYTVRARFAGGPEVAAGKVTVAPGETVTVRCVAAFRLCSRM